ncbi:DUF6214 family protein [Streptomyces sp. NPDC059786]|uniref:DUF6214 family protein n=1 Tax=Streptomyces sp. NPDC059786 TaxID=3346946 RepID=UPI003661DB51
MSVWPAWEVREHESATSWFNVRLGFADGARIDVLAVVDEEQVSIEDVRARPPLSLDDLTLLPEWLEGPLFEACCAGADGPSGKPRRTAPARRARPAWPHGTEGWRLVAEEYRAAQRDGLDPVLAVMGTTGHSRRRSLGLIAAARDAGFLPSRHARR